VILKNQLIVPVGLLTDFYDFSATIHRSNKKYC